MAYEHLLDRPLNELNLVFFDIETTGLEPASSHIIEVAAVTVRSGQEIAHFTSFVRPVAAGLLFSTVEVPPEITKITGISSADLEGQPTFAEVLSDLNKSFSDGILVAHNAEFDLSFLALQMKQMGKLPASPVLDTLRLSRAVAPELASHSMDNLKPIYGIKSDRAHRALDDTRALAQLFPKLVARAFPSPDVTVRQLLTKHGPFLPFEVPPPRAKRERRFASS